ncbi:MAG: hypothetical protein RQ824_10910 [bacterium]|nr:hypothetical protein [bacterium]
MSVFKAYIFLYATAVLMLFPQLSASAIRPSLEGAASLGYRAGEMSQGGSDVENVDELYQRYSLLAKASGNLYNRRGGPYKLSMGYHNLSYLTNVNDQKYSPSLSLFSWDGDLKLLMPHLHGLDLLLYSSSRAGVQPKHKGVSVKSLSDLVIGLEKTETNRSGFDLKLGVNGGPYYYLYRNMYSYADDEELYEDYDMFGMSIESGVNWLHVYREKSKPNGLEKRTYHFGNIGLPERGSSVLGVYSLDVSKRLWYGLTNWLDLSADFLYSDEETNDGDISTERMTFAFKGDLDRTSMASYFIGTRVDSDLQVARSIALPFWADHWFAPGTVLSVVNDYTESENESYPSMVVERRRTLDDRLILTSNNDKLFLETGYKLNKLDATDEDRESHSIYFEGYTRRKETFDYAASYVYDTDKSSDAIYDDKTSYSHNLSGSLYYWPNREIQTTLKQGYIYVSASDNPSFDKQEIFITTFSIVKNSSLGLRSYLDLNRINTLYGDGTEGLLHTVSLSLQNEIAKRLQVDFSVNYANEKNDSSGADIEDESLTSRADIRYKLVRNLQSDTFLQTSQRNTTGQNSVSGFEAEERLEYSYYNSSFSKRKLFDLAGSIWYEKLTVGNTDDDRNRLEMAFNYYPTRALSCGVSYSYDSDIETAIRSLYAALRYPLFTMDVGYTKSISEIGNVKKDSYNINLTKRF